jgi:malate permease and related proteins
MTDRWITAQPPWLLVGAATLGAAGLSACVVVAGTALLTPEVFGFGTAVREAATMGNFVTLGLCLLAGMVLRASGRTGEQAHQPINAVIVHVSLPALTLYTLRGFDLDAAHLGPVLMPWLLFIVGAAVFWLAGRALRLPPRTVGALTLVGGFGNTSFVGLPMIESLHGSDGMALGLLIDQLGSYLALSTIGLLAATVYAAEGRITASGMLKRVAVFPPFIALVLALVLMPVAFPPELMHALKRIGDTLAPLALLSAGLQLRFDTLRRQVQPLCLGLAFKLLACPALVIGVLLLFDAGNGMAQRVSVIEAAMPPMIGAGVVATQAKLDAPLVSALIGIGIPLGLLTVPAWHWLFGLLVG